MKNWKASVVLAMGLACLPFLALGQKQPTPALSDPIGRFLGTWDLHMKEAPGVPERESLTIEQTENGIKITHLVAFDNDTVLHYWGVMDSTGKFVQMRQTNGEPMNEEWRIVSVDANALIIETRPFGGKNKYQVSADGQTLKMNRLTATVMSLRPSPDLTFLKSK